MIPKFRIEDAVTWDHHRGGWKQAMYHLARRLHVADGTLFIPSVDEFLVSGRVLHEPWVGVIHGVPRSPYPFPDLKRLLDLDVFRANMHSCAGLWALSKYIREYLVSQDLPMPVGVVPYAVDTEVPYFDFGAFRAARSRRLILVGEYLRRYESFYRLNVPGYRKFLLRCFPDSDDQRDLRSERGVKVLDRIDDARYDAWLASSVVFLDLIDSSANTAICECIVRATPVLVNRVGSVVEYLSADYPFYYETLEEAQAKLADMELIAKAVNHLRRRQRELSLDFDNFVHNFANHAITRSLPVPQSQAGDFRRCNVTVLICSYRRTQNLTAILRSLRRQTFKGSFEVIIWNNNIGAQAEIDRIVEPFRAKLDLAVVHSQRNYYCVVRLAMPHLMRGDLLMICDDDVRPNANYLATFVAGLEAAGERSIVCARGHTFEPHELDWETPDHAWRRPEHLKFWNETSPPRDVHFMHADNCLIPRQALLELSAIGLPEPQVALVDDYWMSMALSKDLGWRLRKIKADRAFAFDPAAEDPDVALYLNASVQSQRTDFYVRHMREGWPTGCRAWPQGPARDATAARPATKAAAKRRRPAG